MRLGRCLCGAVRFTARGAPKWVAHCHCASCRKATSAAFATYAGYGEGEVEWSGRKPKVHRSSPGVERGFCPRCGSPLYYASGRWPGEVHLNDGLPEYQTTSSGN